MEPHTIFFIGKPGCGKGTQAKLLAEVTGLPVIGTSGGLREIVASGGGVGQKLRETMDSGLLTPHWLAAYVYIKTLISIPEKESVIFDGTSRTLPEAHIVLDSLRWVGKPFSIFHLSVSDDVVRARISLRRRTEERKDDHAIDKRLEEYYTLTEEAIEFFRTEGVLTELDGEQAPEVIAANVRGALKL